MNFNSHDEQAFLHRLTSIVEINLSTEQFGVSELSAKVGVNRSQVHRRLKKITNKSVSQFIREIRLKKAKELLEAGNLTISEIAYKVGFGSPSYFIKCFHEYFGYAPGEYVKYAGESNLKNSSEKNAVSIESGKHEAVS
jgi:AraC-like DNA-binding protein